MPRNKKAAVSDGSKEAMIAEANKRMARINQYLDLVPPYVFLGYEHSVLKNSQWSLDPEQAKSTSRLLVEAAVADGIRDAAEKEAGAGAGGGGSQSSSRGKKRRAKDKAVSEPAFSVDDGATASTRRELKEKLQKRLKELREERKRRQSEADKATAAKIRESKGQGEVPEHRKPKEEETVASAGDGESAEVGRLSFAPKTSSLPFEAEVGKRGVKVQRLRTELRRQETESAKVRKAEERGSAEEVLSSLAMQKALKRAQGSKVHDDSKKLRKAQKAKDMKRKKGRAKREEQEKDVKRQQQERQDKRKENLQKRVTAKKKKRTPFTTEE